MMSGEKFYLGGLWRPFTYALCIFFILYFLSIQQFQNSKELFLLYSFIGGLLIFEESFFTVYYANKYSAKALDYVVHGLNHTIYPQFFYVGLVVYSYLQRSYELSFILALLGFFIYFLYYYYLPKHIHDDHGDHVLSEKHSTRVDFILYVFKFFSYFTFHIGLFELLRQGIINGWIFIITNIIVNYIYLYAHLSRKYEANFINLFIAGLFSIITATFIAKLKVPASDYSASIATLVFYLSSGIFYHKVDGSFSYKVFIEYASIALILSVFLFAI